MRVRVYLDTNNSCNRFCETVRSLEGKGELVNKSGRYRVSAVSLVGCLITFAEWGGVIYFESEEDYYIELSEWITDIADDNASIHF